MKDRKGNVGIIVSVNTGGGTPSASLFKYIKFIFFPFC